MNRCSRNYMHVDKLIEYNTGIIYVKTKKNSSVVYNEIQIKAFNFEKNTNFKLGDRNITKRIYTIKI